jgi:hypothetical protein
MASATTPEDRLRFYASQFPIVEIDSPYYGIALLRHSSNRERTTVGGAHATGLRLQHQDLSALHAAPNAHPQHGQRVARSAWEL